MITKKLMVKNGSYQKDGEEKNRWLQIGAVHEYEGREYITLDRHVNLAGLPTKEGDTRVFVSMFDNDSEQRPAAAPKARKPAASEPFDDDSIPFARPISADGLCMPGDSGAWFGPNFSPWTVGA